LRHRNIDRYHIVKCIKGIKCLLCFRLDRGHVIAFQSSDLTGIVFITPPWQRKQQGRGPLGGPDSRRLLGWADSGRTQN
jgi:hypothetical protein